MDGKCEKCEILPDVPETPSKILILSAHSLMLHKIKNYILTKNLKIEELEEGILVRAENPKRLLESLKRELPLSKPELEDVSLVFLSNNEKPSLKHFRELRRLSLWFEFLENADYFNVLKENRLTVYFHPIVDRQLKVTGYECLIRGVQPDGTILSPAFLFEKAERTQTLFYLDRACRETAIKTSAVKGIREKFIFINFIPTSIYDPKYCLQTTIKWAYQLEFDPSNIVFEVVESQKVTDLRHLTNILSYYKENGFKVALDDVGTGYASLEMLVHLRPNFVKIDREIVRDVHLDPLKQSIVKALTQICRENNIISLAEGIEKQEEFLHLRDKVDYFQGFYFAKPHPEPIRVINPGN